MPRDGSGNYTLPYPAVVDGTTIESAVHNGTMSDIALQLNGPLPIIAGGTGANNAATAMVNLKGEVTNQTVTNYDSFPFVSGSFWSSPGATGAPEATDYYTGIAYLLATNTDWVTLEARGSTTGKLYVRQKVTGTWGAWKEQPGSVADTDARYVNLTGDVMTGNLAVPNLDIPAGGYVQFYNPANSGQFRIAYSAADLSLRWNFNSGATIMALSNAGMLSTTTMLADGLIANSAVTSGQSGATGAYYFGNTGTKYLNYDGAQFNLVGGTLVAPYIVSKGNLHVGQDSATSAIAYFGTGSSKNIGIDSTGNFIVNGAAWVVNGGIATISAPASGIVYFGSGGTRWLQHDTVNFSFGGANNVIAPGYAVNGNLTLATNYSLDVAASSQFTVGVGANYLILQTFSGLIIATSITHGYTDVFAVGAGAVSRIGGSGGSTAHSLCSYAPAQNGYVLGNNTGATSTFGVAAIRTKVGA